MEKLFDVKVAWCKVSMDCDINTSKYRCLGLSGYPASSSFFVV